MSFVRSIILSRLTFNAHVRLLQPRELCVLNNPYMRALRRIARELRHDITTASSDLVVRKMLNAPSID
eukprot:10392536-Heterocapsa_arctica.AAC.1